MNANHQENTVIKHYKKQLIFRQSDNVMPYKQYQIQEPGQAKDPYDFISDCDKKCDDNNNDSIDRNGRKVRKKRKNKICRGQFRHEGMELIKLGASAPSTLCKSKERIPAINERVSEIYNKRNQPLCNLAATERLQEMNNTIYSSNIETITKPGHALPQMVPQRRNSNGKIATTTSQSFVAPPKAQVVNNTQLLRPPVPAAFPHPLPQNAQATNRSFPPYPVTHPAHPHPPVFPNFFSPPTPVNYLQPPPYNFPRSLPPPYPTKLISNSSQPFHRPYTGGFHQYKLPPPIPPPTQNVHPRPPLQAEKRKLPPEENSPTAIDLTVDQNHNDKVTCHCECKKAQEVIIKVPEGFKKKKSSVILKGKLVDGVLRFDTNEVPTISLEQKIAKNGNIVIRVEDNKRKIEEKPRSGLTDLHFLKTFLEKAKSTAGTTSPAVAAQILQKALDEVSKKPQNPKKTKPGVIVSNFPQDFQRRKSMDIETISISSSGSDSGASPGRYENKVPKGKLFYLREKNSFIRYFEESQKKLFHNSLQAERSEPDALDDSTEVINVPKAFSSKDKLTLEEFLEEMGLVERYIPNDFFHFYKYVTGYQICKNNLPVSFLTFLNIYNTNGLKELLDKYVSGLSGKHI